MILATVVILFVRTVLSFQQCPILGPGFPSPRNLSSSTVIKSASSNFTSLIESVISTAQSPYGPFDSNTTTFSLEVFSTSDDSPLYQYHHTASGLAYSGTGVRNVDSNTIYRIGSVTKLLTVYSFLISAGDAYFQDPVTKYVPELLAAANANPSFTNPVSNVAWKDITLGQLASQMAGIGRDSSLEGEITQTTLDWASSGFPPLDNSSIPTCGVDPLCDRKEFFENFIKRPPVYSPATTPVYSNVAFQILAYCLEQIVGKDFVTIFDESIVNSLGLTGTAMVIPQNDTFTTRGIIPVSVADSGWSIEGGDEDPAGTAYSTPNELTSIGRSILRSTLISQAQTRRWMKPISRTALPSYSVGMPWEIGTFTDPSTSQIMDMYTKSGNLGVYSAVLVLLPDYNVGFTVMTAGGSNLVVAETIAEMLANTFVPATIDAAREEANTNYAGTYTSTDITLNSSLTLTTSTSQLGLNVVSWISNSTDMLAVSADLVLRSPGSEIMITLYPTDLKASCSNGNSRITFRAVFKDPSAKNPGGIFTNTCQSWIFMEEIVYGRLSLDEFVFTINEDGNAERVVPSALRAELRRVK